MVFASFARIALLTDISALWSSKVPDVESREDLIKNHYMARIAELTSQLQLADSKSVHFYAEVSAVRQIAIPPLPDPSGQVTVLFRPCVWISHSSGWLVHMPLQHVHFSQCETVCHFQVPAGEVTGSGSLSAARVVSFEGLIEIICVSGRGHVHVQSAR